MQRILLPMLTTLGLATGCYTHGDVGVGYSYGYAAPAPSMYYVNDGVSVVAYSDYPVFYSDNYYWRFDNGLWFRSSYYNGGWVAWNDVPYRVRTIDRPYRYARFTPGEGWSRQPAPGVRDHRYYRGGNNNGYRGGNYNRTAPGPTVRDHRGTYAPAPRPVYQAPATRDHRAPTNTAPRSSPTYTAPRSPVHRAPPPASAPVRRDHRR